MVWGTLKSTICSALIQDTHLMSYFPSCQSSSLATATVAPHAFAAEPFVGGTLFPSAAPGGHDSCPADSPWSCSAGTSSSCCYEGSNGIFLQTQFWDYSPATGPNDSWTMHGLWSDRCSGGYQQFCNPQWEISSAEATLEQLGMDSLVQQMSTYWKNQGGSDNSLWTHEFNKHGTCMSTVSPSCYGSDQPANQNVGDFFSRAFGLYEDLPTYEWLESAGILPSEDQTWTVSQFSDALLQHTDGKSVYLGCDRNNAIYQVWYFFSLRGSVADGEFKFIDSISTSSCTDGFSYLPKNENGGGGGDGDDGGDNGGSTQRGYIYAIPEGQSSSEGCLISDGSWYTSGTCATFRFKQTVGGVSISSSKGPCGLVNGSFKCARSVSETDFELQNGNIVFGGDETWSAPEVPESYDRVSVSPNENGQVLLTLSSNVSF